MSWVIYNPNTKTIEGIGGTIIINVDDNECDSAEALESYLDDYWHLGIPLDRVIELARRVQ